MDLWFLNPHVRDQFKNCNNKRPTSLYFEQSIEIWALKNFPLYGGRINTGAQYSCEMW